MSGDAGLNNVPTVVEHTESQLNQTEDGDYKRSFEHYNDTHTTDVIPDDSQSFLLVPLAVLLGIMALSALVCLMTRSQRRVESNYFRGKRFIKTRLKYGRRRKIYEPDFRDENTVGISDDFLDDDDLTECLLNGKLEIDHRFDTYRSTQTFQSGLDKKEMHM